MRLPGFWESLETFALQRSEEFLRLWVLDQFQEFSGCRGDGCTNRLEFLGPKPQSGDPVAQGSEPTDLGEAEYGEEIAPVRA